MSPPRRTPRVNLLRLVYDSVYSPSTSYIYRPDADMYCVVQDFVFMLNDGVSGAICAIETAWTIS